VSIEPRVHAPAYQVLAAELRAEITSGRLRPGQRLPTEPELCARSGVSRSTVREALRLLSSQHLIVTTRGVTGGSFVAQPSPAELAESLALGVRLLLATATVGVTDLMEVREMLEIPAVGLAAQRRTEADLDRLRATLFDPVHDDLRTRLDAHRAFHAALAAAAGNPLYELLTSPLYAVADEGRLVDSAGSSLWLHVDAEHREILRCVVEGDGTGAQRAATWHLARLRTTWPRQPRPRLAPDGLGSAGTGCEQETGPEAAGFTGSPASQQASPAWSAVS
jgi:DNA-binding FadR family transcriptional regulator